MRYVDVKVDVSLIGRNMGKWRNNGGSLDGEVIRGKLDWRQNSEIEWEVKWGKELK